MPTYEYSCDHCGHHFERFQGMNEERLKRCPECRHKVKRLLGTGAGIIFKGSGFYETDYRRKSSSGGPSESSSEPKTESTPSKSDGADKKKAETAKD